MSTALSWSIYVSSSINFFIIFTSNASSYICILVIWGYNFSRFYSRLTILPGAVKFFERNRIPLVSEPIIQSLRPFSVGHRFLEKKIKTGEGVEDSIDFSSETNLYRLELLVEKEFANRNNFWFLGFTPKVHVTGVEMPSVDNVDTMNPMTS